MKKLIALLLAVGMIFSLAACTSNKKETTATENVVDEETDQSVGEVLEEVVEDADTPATVKIAYVTDLNGDIKDHSFNQYSYQGVTLFCEESGLKCNYYTPAADTDEARRNAIDQAIAEGYGVIVMAGSLFGPVAADAAAANPNVLFLALDVTIDDLDADSCPENLALICYREEQAGYLAGYAVVKGGYTELGFLGGDTVPAVVRYGYGFVQGAEAAAAELDIDNVHINYWYSGSFNTNDEITTKVDNWYVSGTEVIFVCGGSIYLSSIASAEANECKVIGVDVDQSADSECIITSAMKDLSHSVQLALTDAADNNWTWPETYAGTCQYLGAAENGIGLPMESTTIEGFTQEDYDALYAALADGSITVDDSCDPAVHPETSRVTVYWE